MRCQLSFVRMFRKLSCFFVRWVKVTIFYEINFDSIVAITLRRRKYVAGGQRFVADLCPSTNSNATLDPCITASLQHVRCVARPAPITNLDRLARTSRLEQQRRHSRVYTRSSSPPPACCPAARRTIFRCRPPLVVWVHQGVVVRASWAFFPARRRKGGEVMRSKQQRHRSVSGRVRARCGECHRSSIMVDLFIMQ